MARVDRRTLGHEAESFAAHYLASRGARLIDRNFRCRLGEIDIIADDGRCLAFVEVRYRGPGSYANAGATIDERKQLRLVRTAAMYIARHAQCDQRTMRFDVVTIDESPDGRRRINWIKDAFRPADARL